MRHSSHNVLKVFIVVILIVGVATGACAATPYVRENAPTYMKAVLSNGIPLYMKVQNANQVFHVSLVLDGASLVTAPEQAGWEKIALATMARSSKNYPYEKAASILDRRSSVITGAVQFEYSTFSLTTLSKYSDELLALWSDMLVNPSFDQFDFDKEKENALLALQAMEQNPWTMTQKIMNEAYFKGHPYGVNPEGTEESIAPMMVGDARDWYEKHFSADRIFLVAVGDFNPAELAYKLEKLLGDIPNLNLGPVPKPPNFPMGSSGSELALGSLITQAHDQSKGIIYLRGDFSAPAPGSDDFFATTLATSIFSDLLFAVVRDKYGAVYTPSAAIRSHTANYGSIMIYKSDAPQKIKQYIDEAVALMAQGRVVSVDPTKTDADGYMGLSDALDTYKQLYINDYFEAVRTNAAIASLMIRSIKLTGNPADWLKDQNRIEILDASAVYNAFEKYVHNGTFLWVAVGDQALLDKLDWKAFESMR